MPESFDILSAVERGYARVTDMPAVLGASRQRCDQLTRIDGFPAPSVVAGRGAWTLPSRSAGQAVVVGHEALAHP
jgi:hypothetical protein